MLDFETARQKMVDSQVRPNDVTSHELLAALFEVPREDFVPERMSELAYLDEDIEITPGRYLMEAAPFAKLAQALSAGPQDVVLVIGSGTGYSAAVLSRIASMVFAVEEDAGLAERSVELLANLGYGNIVVREAPLSSGYPAEGPYDAILVEGSVDRVPETVLAQLREDGRLVAVIGEGNSGVAMLYTRSNGEISSRRLFNLAVRALPGFEAEPEFVL